MTSGFARPATALAAAISMLTLAGCGTTAGGGSNPAPITGSQMPANSAPMTTLRIPAAMRGMDADLTAAESSAAILPQLTRSLTIGSTIDPPSGDLNPYGLDVARVSAGLIHAGDLVVCNFNDDRNDQGSGTSIVALAPRAGATPRHIISDPSLKGCNALAIGATGNIWNAAFLANDNPIVSPAGTVVTTLPAGPWNRPFGEAFSPRAGPFGNAAFYVSNAGDGSIVRVNITSHGFTFDVIATGFAINHGQPGSILGPSGLQYDNAHDRLWIVDGADNSVNVMQFVSQFPAGAVVAHANGTFTGPGAPFTRRMAHGPPFNGPISSALLPGGHLVIGNTLDPDGTNLMIEIAPNGTVLATRNVDRGAAGALFGMVATGDSDANTKIYYNDDNDNALRVLTH